MCDGRYVLTITPNPCIDVTLFADGRRDTQSGGKGVNVARVLGNLGANVRALTFADAALAPLLKAEGIHAAALERAVRVVTTHVGPSYEQRVDMRRGAPLTEGEGDALYNLFLEQVSGASFVLLGGALPGPLERSSGPADLLYARVVGRCRRQGVPVWLDAHGPGVKEALAERPDYWKPNEQEWTRLTGMPATVDNVRAWLKKNSADTTVLLTMGHRGAACVTAEASFEQPAFAIDAINPVGSGDSFSAAFIYGLTRGLPVAQCLRLACAAGAANAAMFPAACIGWADIDAVCAVI